MPTVPIEGVWSRIQCSRQDSAGVVLYVGGATVRPLINATYTKIIMVRSTIYVGKTYSIYIVLNVILCLMEDVTRCRIFGGPVNKRY